MTRSYLSDERKKPEKEFLVYHEEWVGKNWLGEKLVCSDNFEGVYTEVNSAPEVKFKPAESAITSLQTLKRREKGIDINLFWAFDNF